MSSKINSIYIVANILNYFPPIQKLKLIKYSKQYQKFMNISIEAYQSAFIYNHEKILKKYLYLSERKEKIVNYEKLYDNRNSQHMLYISLIKILKGEKYLKISDNEFNEIYKYLKIGNSINLEINEDIEYNLLEERIKLLGNKNINFKEILYVFEGGKLYKELIYKFFQENKNSNIYISYKKKKTQIFFSNKKTTINLLLLFGISHINCINELFLNLIELDIEFSANSFKITNPTKPYKLPNLRELKCYNFFPDFYDLKNIVKIEYEYSIIESDEYTFLNGSYCGPEKIECEHFEKEFPFIIKFFRREYTPMEFLLNDFEQNKNHINLKYIYLSYYVKQSYQESDYISYINKIYKRDFEKNKIKISGNTEDLYMRKMKIPHNISNKFSSIKVINEREKEYYENRIYHHSPYEKIDIFTLKIKEDPEFSNIKEIYFPYLPYKYILKNSTINIKSYKSLEKIILYVYHFNCINSKLFDNDNSIQLNSLKKAYLYFGKINIDIFRSKIYNFLKKVSNDIKIITISINNTYEYCLNVKDYIFSIPFIIKNDKLKNKIIITKMRNVNENDEGKYEFKNDDDDEYGSDSDSDIYLSDYIIIEKSTNKKKRKKNK